MRKRTKAKLLFICAFLAIAVFLYFDSIDEKVCFDENCFKVSVADSPEERALGLMNVKSLGENKGMLFVFDESDFHSFWMKNTLIPLDMIWIDSEYRVVHIKANARPCVVSNEGLCPSYSPNKKALYVLELNSGKAEEYGISVGDEVVFRNLG